MNLELNRNSFEVTTPEKCYILQAENHRAKVSDIIRAQSLYYDTVMID